MWNQLNHLRCLFVFLLAICGCTQPVAVPTPAQAQVQVQPQPPGPTVVSISAGGSHTCAVTDKGRLLCWGAYASNGLTDPGVSRPAPIDDATDWKLVDAGDALTCALKNDDSLWCFAAHDGGFASAGKALSGIPKRIGSMNWESIAVSGLQVCGIRTGQAFCLAHRDIANAEKFGHPITDEMFQPIEGLVNPRVIAPGLANGCAVLANGELWCWGFLGRKEAKSPIRIGSRTDWQNVAMSTRGGAATTSDGTVYSWFPTDPLKSKSPAEASVLGIAATSIDQLVVGLGFGCAPTEAGWQCWGEFQRGQRGPNVTDATPSPAPSADAWTVMTAGDRHVCGVKEGRAYCWGDNQFGQLGNGTQDPAGGPTALATDVAFRSISTSVFHACGITTADDLYCWGVNNMGQFDSALRGSAASPRKQFEDAKWKDVSVSQAGNYAIRADGTLWFFGFGEMRQLTDASDWRDVEHGSEVCATKNDGSLWCWLDGFRGNPTKLSDTAWERTFSVGYASVCGLFLDGTTECFQIKPKSGADRPYRLSSNRWKAFQTAGSEVCSIDESGTLGCFDGYSGKRPSRAYDPPSFRPFASKAKWTGLSVGDAHSCAIQADGSLWCWGFDRSGALGLGPGVEKAKTPTQVGELKWSYISVGLESSCGVTTDGKAHCWGRRPIVGDGQWFQATPQAVVAAEN